MSIDLQWQVSTAASYLHAAAQMHQGRQVEERVQAALGETVARLRAAFAEERVPPQPFWGVAVVMAPDFLSLPALVEVVLAKTIGSVEARPRVRRFVNLFQDLRQAFQQIYPSVEESLDVPFQTLRQQWDRIGSSILGAVVPWTDPDLLVERALVVGLQPVTSGGGVAHLPSNRVAIELVDGDPNPGRPEVLRLAWLLSQLNLDVPRFGDLQRDRRDRVAALAMIPVTLAAGETAQVIQPGITLEQAVEAWLPAEKASATLVEWWDVYRTMRPSWGNALEALDRLLAEVP